MSVKIKNIELIQAFSLKEGYSLHCGVFAFVFSHLEYLQKLANSFLHPKELSYCLSLSHCALQEDYLIGRYAAKAAAAEYGIELKTMHIEPGVFYQPIVYSQGDKKVQISISHCKGKAVAIIFPESHPMGVDIERIDQAVASAIEDNLTFREKQLSLSLNDYRSHILLWTLKEALSKVLRTGLLSPFEIYELQAIHKQDNKSWLAHFTNFPQYQGFAFSFWGLICSIVYPKQMTFNFDLNSFLQKLAQQEVFKESIENINFND